MKPEFAERLLSREPGAIETARAFGRILRGWSKGAEAVSADGGPHADVFLRRGLWRVEFGEKDAGVLDSLREAGLITEFGSDERSGVMVHRDVMDVERQDADLDRDLNPKSPWFVATDWPDIPPEDPLIGVNAVFPIHYESVYLLKLLSAQGPGLQGLTVLDMFCGSGILGLFAALKGAGRVSFVDINPRALAFTIFNVLLNDAGPGHEYLKLDVFDNLSEGPGLGGRRFDVILANPPFEPVPAGTYPRHSNGGVFGQDVIAKLLAGAGKHLKPRGYILAVDFSPGRDVEVGEAEEGSGDECDPGSHFDGIHALSAAGLRPEIESLRSEGLQCRVEVLDQIALDVFGARFVALGLSGYAAWQWEQQKKRYDWLYFLSFEFKPADPTGTDAAFRVRDRRSEGSISCSDWEDPLFWDAPFGIPIARFAEWQSILLHRKEYRDVQRINLLNEKLLLADSNRGTDGTPVYFDFLRLLEDRTAEAARLRTALVKSLSEMLTSRLQGGFRPRLIRFFFIPSANGRGEGATDSGLITTVPKDGGEASLGKRVQLTEMRASLKEIAGAADNAALILRLDVVARDVLRCESYRDLVEFTLSWKGLSYPPRDARTARPERDEGWWDDVGPKTRSGEKGVQTYIACLFPGSGPGRRGTRREHRLLDNLFARYDEDARRSESGLNLLFEECFSAMTRQLTVLAGVAVSLAHLDELRERTQGLIHDFRNVFLPFADVSSWASDESTVLPKAGKILFDLLPGSSENSGPWVSAVIQKEGIRWLEAGVASGAMSLRGSLERWARAWKGVDRLITANGDIFRGVPDRGESVRAHELADELAAVVNVALGRAYVSPRLRLGKIGSEVLGDGQGTGIRDYLRSTVKFSGPQVFPLASVGFIVMPEIIGNCLSHGARGGKVELDYSVNGSEFLMTVRNEPRHDDRRNSGLGQRRISEVLWANLGTNDGYRLTPTRDGGKVVAWTTTLRVDLDDYRRRREEALKSGSYMDSRSEEGTA
jgi:methylase of polypeptide subunit release factors